LNQVNYYNIIKRIVILKDDKFRIKELELNLKEFDNIYLVGGGKNVSFTTIALEENEGSFPSFVIDLTHYDVKILSTRRFK